MNAPTLDTEVRVLMRPGLVTISGDASLQQTKLALLRHNVHAVLVIGAQGQPLGWVTARALLSLSAEDPRLVTASQAVCEPPRRISPNATGREAIAALLEHGATRLLVAPTEGDPPEGVVADMDLLAASV